MLPGGILPSQRDLQCGSSGYSGLGRTWGQAPPETLVLRGCEEPWPSLSKWQPFASASQVHCSAPQERSNLGWEVSGALNLPTIHVVSSHIMAGSLRTWTQQEA